MRRGITMVEVAIAALLLGLLAGPLFTLLQATTKATTASVYEILATHYAAELGDQLQKLAPRLKEINLRTGQTLDVLLDDQAFLKQLGPTAEPKGVPLLARLPGTNIRLLLSPLDPHFTVRSVDAELLDPLPTPASDHILNEEDSYWRVTISLSWKNQVHDAVTRTALFQFVLREEPTP